jgi:hypothetical protein
MPSDQEEEKLGSVSWLQQLRRRLYLETLSSLRYEV